MEKELGRLHANATSTEDFGNHTSALPGRQQLDGWSVQHRWQSAVKGWGQRGFTAPGASPDKFWYLLFFSTG